MIKRIVVLGALALAVMLGAPSGALAGDTICPDFASGEGLLPPGRYDNIVAPPGTTCAFRDVIVKGNVKALEDSRLGIDFSTVQGNIEADKADAVAVARETVVLGNIQIKEGGPDTGTAGGGPVTVEVCGSTLPNGNIQVEKMTGDIRIGTGGPHGFSCGTGNTLEKGNIMVQENNIEAIPGQPSQGLSIEGNAVAGNLQVFKNTGDGPITIEGNTVRESLQCKENTNPIFADGNTAREAEGQCSAPAEEPEPEPEPPPAG
jgi:hypothetical protein